MAGRLDTIASVGSAELSHGTLRTLSTASCGSAVPTASGSTPASLGDHATADVQGSQRGASPELKVRERRPVPRKRPGKPSTADLLRSMDRAALLEK